MDPRMKTPGPGHPISIRPAAGAVRVVWRGRVIGRSTNAVVLSETVLPDVVYVPRGDIEEKYLERAARSTFCPYKGDASYYSLVDGEERDECAVWSYERPYPEMEPIRDRLAFYADKAQVEPE